MRHGSRSEDDGLERLRAFFRDDLRAAEAGEPSPDELAAYVDGTLAPEEREGIDLALADDPALRREVDDLRALRDALHSVPRARPRRPAVIAGALAAAFLGGVALWLLPREPGAPETAQNVRPAVPAAASPLFSLSDAGGPLSLFADGRLGGDAGDALPAEVRARVVAALRVGRPEVPASVRALRGERGTLMDAGAPPASSALELIAPLGTAVRSERPIFSWRPHPEARAYVVSVYDEHLNPRASSGEVRAATWTSSVALERGRSYLWQVAALTGAGRILAPRPPAPEARFLVLAAADEAALASRLARSRGSHLVAGVLLAEAGVLDEAERELRALAAANPGQADVQRLLTGLR